MSPPKPLKPRRRRRLLAHRVPQDGPPRNNAHQHGSAGRTPRSPVGCTLKVLYLVIRNPITNRTNVTGRTTGWTAALNALALFYGDRITLN